MNKIIYWRFLTLKNQTSKTFLGNLIRCRTLGCCMGFRKDVVGEHLKNLQRL